ncbi:MAG: SPOCS domain-containing protein [Faecalibacterium sp.]
MELKIFRDTLPAAGGSCTVKAELPLETEILISDYQPQVFKLVKCFARPVVLQKQLQPGRLTLEGYLRCTVYYQGEDGAGLCQTEQKLPFTKVLELPEFSFSAWTASVEGQTEYLNCRAVNPRRIEVRGAFGLVASVHAQIRTEVITALADGGVEQKLCTLSGARRAAVLDKLITADGELSFPKEPEEILDMTGTAQIRELKLLTGKAVAKGEIQVLCAWRAQGENTLQSQTVTLAFNQILDAEGISEDCKCLCVVEPVGFTVAQGESGAPAQLTATAMLHLRAWRPYELQAVADAFSTRFETSLTPQPVITEQLALLLDETVTVTGSGPLPDAGARLMACFAAFGPAQILPQGAGFALTARVIVTAFGENSLGELESYEKALEVSVPLELDAPSNAQIYPECWLSAENLQCSCTGGTLEAAVTVRIEGAVFCRKTHTCVGSIELGDPLRSADPEISLRIYYAQAGEELFGIAQRFHVSPGQMLAANGLDPDTGILSEEKRLLVPGA